MEMLKLWKLQIGVDCKANSKQLNFIKMLFFAAQHESIQLANNPNEGWTNLLQLCVQIADIESCQYWQCWVANAIMESIEGLVIVSSLIF